MARLTLQHVRENLRQLIRTRDATDQRERRRFGSRGAVGELVACALAIIGNPALRRLDCRLWLQRSM